MLRLLGPVELSVGGGVVAIGYAKQRTVLATLALEAGQVVPVDRLVDQVWGDDPPSSVRNVLYGHIARLRRTLAEVEAADLLRGARRSGGYLLAVGPESVDLHRFRALVADARAASDDPVAATSLRAALEMWRGPALAGTDGPWPNQMRDALDNERLAARLSYCDVMLRLGPDNALMSELAELSARHPLHEGVASRHVLVLYRHGGAAEALDRYAQFRRRLADEMGMSPGEQLQLLHRGILRQDPALAGSGHRDRNGGAAVTALSSPAQLPPDIRAFTGRTVELGRLDTVLLDPLPHNTVPLDAVPHNTVPHNTVLRDNAAEDMATTCVISGAATVGKSALALRWSHRSAGEFPDGQLYVDLLGQHDRLPPLPPERALRQLLAALGVSSGPGRRADPVGQYRTLLANRRTLVVLDNAASPDQVRPLLPGGRAARVLVTSRDRLDGLVALDGAVPLRLGVLAPGDSRTLVERLVDDQRVAAEGEAVDELTRQCGYLPLAIRLAATILVRDQHRPIADLAAALATGDPLAALVVPNDPRTSLVVAFGRSYAALPPSARDVFRSLGSMPDRDVTAVTVAPLLGVDVDDAERGLDTLAAAHLLEAGTGGRYHLGGLTQRFAAGLAHGSYGVEHEPEHQHERGGR